MVNVSTKFAVPALQKNWSLTLVATKKINGQCWQYWVVYFDALVSTNKIEGYSLNNELELNAVDEFYNMGWNFGEMMVRGLKWVCMVGIFT